MPGLSSFLFRTDMHAQKSIERMYNLYLGAGTGPGSGVLYFFVLYRLSQIVHAY